MLKAGILGASGYGGAELIRRLARHSGVDLTGFGSRQYEGQELQAAWPQLAGTGLGGHRFADNDTVIADADVVFFATPHGATAPLVAQARAAGKLVVDLSADVRLSAAAYAEWYGGEHPAPGLIADAVYGFVEMHGIEHPSARLSASPGCNATEVCLTLADLAAAGQLVDVTAGTLATGFSGEG